MEQIRSIEEINDKIRRGDAVIVRADEMTEIVREKGPEKAAKEVDVVTTGTFGLMCSSGVFMNFGHGDPPIKMQRVWLNDVEAYTGIAAVDAYLGATQLSETKGMEYGGGHVIEDLIREREIELRATAYGTDCYPRKEVETIITIHDLNQAIMVNPRNAYQKYNAATNSTGKTLYTYMGELLPKYGNVTYSGAGELSPLSNDPDYETIGIGTRIFLGGTQGYVISEGTQHFPRNQLGTLMVAGNLKEMTPEYIRGAVVPKYGTSLFVGLGIPIPILNVGLARKTGVGDEDLFVNILDYGVPRRDRPVLRKVSYAELKSGKVEIDGHEVRTNPLSSFKKAREIAETLKKWIEEKRFYLTMPVERLSTNRVFNPMPLRKTPKVKEIMTRDVVTVRESDAVEKVASIMINREINHLPVIDEEGRLIGIVTSWDISKAVSQGLKTLGKIMTRKVITTTEEELLEEAARKMAEHNISGLPVIDEERRVRGIITTEDVSKYLGGIKLAKI
jgi:uncharacterized protein (DUF39 family)/CBS domain-containing protein